MSARPDHTSIFRGLFSGRPVNLIAYASANRVPLWGAEISASRKTVVWDRVERGQEMRR
jgi:hypothetical protein